MLNLRKYVPLSRYGTVGESIMTASIRWLWVTSALLVLPAAGATQASPSRHLGAIGACRAITADTVRLACFDREASAFVAAAQSGQVSIVDRAELRAARRSLFGFSLPNLGMFGAKNDQSEPEETKELRSEVVRATTIGAGKYRVVIADQKAVWETTEVSLTGRQPRPGEAVHIKKGSLGSYFIQLGSQKWVKGRRVG